MISDTLLEAIVNYLSTKPYREVHGFIHAVQQEVQAAQSKDKGEE
tara:strand:- start:754 stop:888 length:135 start_codon:yes stop_codon:yes gene_type:complete